MRHLPLVLVSTFSLVSILACGGGKISQCNSFVEVVNAAAPEIQAASSGIATDPASAFTSLQKMADIYGKLEADVGKLEITDEGLKPKVDAYRTTAQEIQKAAATAAAAGNGGDPTAALTALGTIGRLATGQDKQTKEINSYCQGG